MHLALKGFKLFYRKLNWSIELYILIFSANAKSLRHIPCWLEEKYGAQRDVLLLPLVSTQQLFTIGKLETSHWESRARSAYTIHLTSR